MEIQTIENLLKKIKEERFLDVFTKEEYDLDMLKSMSEDELKDALAPLNLPGAVRFKISKEIQAIKAEGKSIILGFSVNIHYFAQKYHLQMNISFLV